ncbi:Uncharacterized protein OS=Singulisphaera acidiphila (strain ATCC BAA-1392 / DSM 18658 / VKM B-2454 / MOB10) GN=Sinac_6872 PE=4 SV=1 [Gemmata massiliana]|uniref:Rho termination factor N-terminal domain-containing protein n=1 Tax=Gemmata massiliana TaxID=1210884 RepID=A0A6P2D297_9BACT|nr:DUF4912 domain-containing protein [Gemmata massiliana]VTR95411.1 Uncharacterized protein OS=Singulisphaera acidiphila (strain ATCC BAA-1392 / DSM 18658 / VKM B-2454 / MOB10) GN=Sinac_6872 PE=4 SV=1 [Gemmata massiliana]
MKTAGSLTDRSKKELAELARRRGVRGWDGMDKPALLKALSKTPAATKPVAKPTKIAAKPTVKVAAKVTKVKKAQPEKGAPVRPTQPVKATAPKPKPKVVAKNSSPAKPEPKIKAVAPTVGKSAVNGSHKAPAVQVAKPVIQPKPAPATAAKPVTKSLVPPREPTKDATANKPFNPVTKDRILLAVSNPYWLNAYWELSSHSVQRAEAALRQDWHGAKLIIRLFDVTSGDTTSTSETPIRDIVLHGTGQNWYIDVPQPPRAYRADIGYVSKRGDFYVLARSNVVTPPKAGVGEAVEGIDAGWDDDDAKWKAERILAMSTGFESTGNPELRELFEERLGRPIGPPKQTAFGTGAVPPGSVKKFFFEIDAKLIVFGRTDPAAHLTLNNDPIKLNSDGTFRMTFNLPDSRQIIPAVAASADGVEERTIVLAVERNTKHLDPMIHDQMNEV